MGRYSICGTFFCLKCRLNHFVILSDAIFCMKFKFGYNILFSNDVIDVHEHYQGIDEQLIKGLKSYPI